MHTEPLSPTTPRPVTRTVFTQAWRNAAFVHWPVDPAVVAPLLPAGVAPDTLDGVTQVGLIAFHMERIGLGPGPGLPYVGTFAETNVRLYTVDGAGRRGVFFLSLDAARLLPVLVGRALGVPYSWARMRIGTGPTYTTRRRWPRPSADRPAAPPSAAGPPAAPPSATGPPAGPRPAADPAAATGPAATSRLVVRPGEPITAPTELERFVTARWGLHLALRSTTGYWPNEHAEWPLHRAELVELDDGLLAAAGLPEPVD